MRAHYLRDVEEMSTEGKFGKYEAYGVFPRPVYGTSHSALPQDGFCSHHAHNTQPPHSTICSSGPNMTVC